MVHDGVQYLDYPFPSAYKHTTETSETKTAGNCNWRALSPANGSISMTPSRTADTCYRSSAGQNGPGQLVDGGPSSRAPHPRSAPPLENRIHLSLITRLTPQSTTHATLPTLVLRQPTDCPKIRRNLGIVSFQFPPPSQSIMAAPARLVPRTIAVRSPRIAQCLSNRRIFTSYDHPPGPGPFGAAEADILAAAYQHVPEHGFSQRALGLGARDAGYLDISASVVPDGAFSLIRYHLVTQREALAPRSQEMFQGDDSPGIGRKVEALTWERLMGNKDVVDRWQEALAIMAQPSYVPVSLKELAKLADEIWFLSGDKAVDPSWYSKRATLSMIYSTSELFMTNDKSPGFADTKQFLQRRLGEVQSLGGIAGSLGQWAGFTLSAGVNVLRSKGVRI
ncbi:hypothetical protein G7046_g9498 [Stylonectria norvegica]|nr:hypothetical protein G7046_g9498 [Stylonectria norvegica]